jgi:acyl-coenzyme A synthetase/AMP-(fatty) acid ligase
MSARQVLPLFEGFQPDDPIAWRGEQPLACSAFLSQAHLLAERLPDKSYVFNLCESHDQFLIGFTASLIRKQISLFPNNRTPYLLKELKTEFPDSYFLSDQAEPLDDEETLLMEETSASVSPTCSGAVPAFPADQTAAIVFTSGSTGKPKQNIKSWASVVQVARITARRFGLSPDRKYAIVATVPPQHMYGFEASIMLPLQSGGAVYAKRPFYAEDIRSALAQVPPGRVLITTPYHLGILARGKQRLPKVDMIVSATAPLSRALSEKTEAGFDTQLYEIYGCTEAGSLASRRTVEEDQWTPLDGIRLAGRGDDCRVLADHIPKPVPLMDFIEPQDDGTFFLGGRTGDMIRIAGKRGSLGELNFHLTEVFGVLDGFFFQPEERDGQVSRLEAVVVAPGKTSKEILQSLRQRLDPAFLPRSIHFLDSLPRDNTGKLPKKGIDALLAKLSTAAPARSEHESPTIPSQTIVIPADHPAFSGHFPGNPVVPGVVILQQVIEHIEPHLDGEAGVTGVDDVKFLSPLLPGEAMTLHFASKREGLVRFDGSTQDRQIVTGTICPRNPFTGKLS